MPSSIVKIAPEQIEDASIVPAKLTDMAGLATALTPHLNFEGGGPHTHPISDVANLQTALNGKAASSHSHTAGEVSGLATVATSGAGGDLTAASVTNAKLADMATGTIKGCVSGSRPADLTTAQVAAALGVPSLVVLANDVSNANAVANTLADVTGLQFPVVANETYRFEIVIPYTAAATTTGSRWVLNGPTLTALYMRSEYPLTATTVTDNCVSAYATPSASNASSLTAGNVATLWGTIRCSANGNVVVRFASEVANSAIVAKAGAHIRWQRVL